MSDRYEAVIGVWDGHDAGVALVVDGRVTLALNEERLSGRKLDVGLPERALAVVRDAARGLRVAYAPTTSDPAKTLTRLFPSMKEDYYKLRRRLAPPGPLHGLKQRAKYALTQWRPTPFFASWTRRIFSRQLEVAESDIFLVNHHESHAASAAYWPEWTRDALVVTLDGIGDGESGSVWEWSQVEGALRKLISIPGSASLGLFFEHVTNELQMRPLEDEGKVMALADHAAPVPDVENPLLALMQVIDGRLISSHSPARLARQLAHVHWSCPNERFAHLAQRMVEVLAAALVREAVRITGCRHVALSGGVASNVKANRTIRHLPEVDDVYVFPHMGDGGLPAGAAIAAWAETSRDRRVEVDPRTLGPVYPVAALELAVQGRGLSPTRPQDLASDVARRLAQGQIVCWFQGAMEYGPRALGQRSVLARPGSLAIKDRLNLVLKRRVWYQPFCPSLLESEAPAILRDWHIGGHSNRDMTMAYQVRPEALEQMRGVVNVDGSCRPQIVRSDDPTPFGDLLRATKRETGIGVLLNTSFNIHGEPLVCTPDEAVDVFLRGGADALVMGPFVAERPGAAFA